MSEESPENTEPFIEPEALNVEKSCEFLGGICRTSFYKLAKEGEFDTATIAGRRVGIVKSMRQYIDRQINAAKLINSNDVRGCDAAE